ncbi:MAG: carbohydrate kinase family protein [Patescibacteria group bacterium]
MKIAVSGSLAYDRIMDFPGNFADHILPEKIHVLNVSFCTSTFREGFGGTAGNIGYSLRLLGEEPIIISQVGSDFNKYEKWLCKNRINPFSIKKYKNELTASAYIITDQNDNQITGFYPGAMKYGSEYNQKKIKQAKYFLISPGNKKDMMDSVLVARKNKIPHIFDFGQQLAILTRSELIKGILGAKIVIANDYEIELMLKKTGLTKKKIFDKIELLITTLGPGGALFETKNRIIKIPPAKPKNTCDPTGAGDAFRAGLIKGLAEGYPLEKVGRLAALVSVYTVEKYGTQTHHFTWSDLKKRYYINFKEKL